MWGSEKIYAQKNPGKTVDNLLKTVDKRQILWRSLYFQEKREKYANYFTPHIWGYVLVLTCIFKESLLV
jgi:tetrahydromethanopterin S-methyltransferase subunit B